MFKPRLTSAATMMAAPALLAAIVAAYTGFWFYNVGVMKQRVADWAAERRALGDTATITVAGATGFPTRMAVELTGVNVVFQTGETAWSLAAPRLELVSHVLSPRAFRVVLTDGAELARTRPQGRDTLRKTGGEAALAVTLNSGDVLRTATFTANGLNLDGVWNGAALASPLSIAAARATVSIEPKLSSGTTAPSARATAAFQGIRLPGNITFPLGQEIANLDLDANVTGPINRGLLYNALQQWREAGGTVALRRIGLRWGSSVVEGSGTLAVDPRLQPIASLTARIEGFVPLVDSLHAATLIRDSDATLARLVLGREMPRLGPANLSLSLRDGTLHAGPLALIQVPPINWPGAPIPHKTPSGAPLMQPGLNLAPDGKTRRKGDPV